MKCRINRSAAAGRALALAAAAGLCWCVPALANNTNAPRVDNGVNCFSAVGGVSALFGGPVGIGVGLFAGGFQIGYYGGRAILDPADPGDAGVLATQAQFLAGNTFPPVASLDPGLDPTLAGLIDNALQPVDAFLADGRAINATVDRYEGALEINNLADIHAQFVNCEALLNDQLQVQCPAWAADSTAVINYIQTNDPTIYNLPLTQAECLTEQSESEAGDLSTLEPTAVSAFNISPTEMTEIEGEAADFGPADVNTFFGGNSTMAIGDAMLEANQYILSGNETQDLPIPEPGPATLVAGMIGLALLLRPRRMAI